jgi:TatD DNase family protein
MIDTHTHLDDEQFDGIRDAVIQRARQAGIQAIVAVGTTAPSSQAVVELASRHKDIYAAVGIQPNYCQQADKNDWDRVVQLAESDRAVAVGETGLDRHWDFTPFAVQQDYFDRHLRLAQRLDLPFIVHMRECEGDILSMLGDARKRGPLRGVMHSFVGDAEMAQACLELGLHVSFAGMVTYKKAQALRAVASEIPPERILIETDCPYLAPRPKRGHRPNEPSLIVHTATCLAEIRGVDIEHFAAQTASNARRLFRLAS